VNFFTPCGGLGFYNYAAAQGPSLVQMSSGVIYDSNIWNSVIILLFVLVELVGPFLLFIGERDVGWRIIFWTPFYSMFVVAVIFSHALITSQLAGIFWLIMLGVVYIAYKFFVPLFPQPKPAKVSRKFSPKAKTRKRRREAKNPERRGNLSNSQRQGLEEWNKATIAEWERRMR
jgi:hypothetical protein